MGEVFRARDPRIGREVAIKVLPASFSHDRDRLRRFEQEARAAGALSHPALLTIFDVGELGETPYLVSELLEGETLRTRLRGGPLSPRRAIEYAIQIARGLAAAHEKGIIHRDIKPENLFITKDGRVKILDFGLAKLRQPKEHGSQGPTMPYHTEPGAVMGTAGYMSPEQVRGEDVDQRSDIFSLGAVLYEALTGNAPFKRGSSIETMSAILGEDPPELQNPQVSLGVARVVSRCLEKHLEARYQSAADLAFHLEQIDNTAPDQKAEGDSFRFGRFQLDLLTSQLRADGKILSISPKEFDLLVFLIRNRQRLVRKEELIDALWPDTHVGGTSLSRAVSTLRTLLGDDARSPQYIETFARRGYRFLADVRSGEASRPQQSSETAPRSVIIVPLTNATGDPRLEYITDGITETVMNRLSSLRSIRVVPRSTSFRYKNRDIDLRQLWQDLAVRFVLTGRASLWEDRLLVSAELSDASEDSQLWGERYYRGIEQILGLPETIALQVAERVVLELTRGEEERVVDTYTENQQAYLAYLEGRFHWGQRSEHALRRAARHFERAISLDPNYAPALSGLVDTHAILASLDAISGHEALSIARPAAERALKIDDSLAEAWTSLAYLDWMELRLTEAEGNFRRAIALNPSYPVAHQWYGSLLATTGRRDEAVQEIERAVALDPDSLIMNTNRGYVLFFLHEFDRAIAQFRSVLHIEPSFLFARWELGMALIQTGAPDEAIAELEAAMRLADIPLVLASLSRAHAAAGNRAAAVELLERLQGLAKVRSVDPYHFAVMQCGLGMTDQALEELRRAVERKSAHVYKAPGDPMLDSLRPDPRFRGIFAATGAAPYVGPRFQESFRSR
jgi:serine/threonine protein kinase/tetratricopeptide (TPR) repeat protein